ncbi:Oxoglutarate-dependent flavonoid 7-O-demethylase 1 [Salvia divinorum]|uniref:Oxoglutarate-dependent flavonoid 7-O-demethylase 1 n=1 Tax=Salvia divinorum TaxID=28513 RepID=A0ABD1HVB6_SALDI
MDSLGSSLKVPIVQELAKEKLTAVPARYIRGGDDNITPSPDHLPPSTHIPIIDMHKLLHPDSSESELRNLHTACQQWGFFQLINHGAESSIIEKMKYEIQEFFNLPSEEKDEFRQQAADVEGYGQAFVVSDEQTLDWGDMFFVTTLPPHLRKPHLIPKLPTAFRDSIEGYGAELKILAVKILKFMAKSLGMELEEMEALFDQGTQSMRMNYYPPCPQPELVTGLYPHSDAVGLTILLQVNEMEGLQIKKDGVWIPVSPLPDAFVINIGDVLEIITNGTYPSIEHRATVNREKERLSIATFLNPKLEAEIGPAASLVGPKTPAKFKSIAGVDYYKGLFSQELNGKSYLEIMRI